MPLGLAYIISFSGVFPLVYTCFTPDENRGNGFRAE